MQKIKKNLIPASSSVRKLWYLELEGFTQNQLVREGIEISQAAISRILKKGVNGYIESETAIKIAKFYNDYKERQYHDFGGKLDLDEEEAIQMVNDIVSGKRIIKAVLGVIALLVFAFYSSYLWGYLYFLQ